MEKDKTEFKFTLVDFATKDCEFDFQFVDRDVPEYEQTHEKKLVLVRITKEIG